MIVKVDMPIFTTIFLQNGCAPVCKVLLGSKHCKGFINKKTNGGKSALHLAAIGGHLGVIFELAQGNTLDADLGDEEKRYSILSV